VKPTEFQSFWFSFHYSSIVYGAFRPNFLKFHQSFFQIFQKLTESVRFDFTPSAEFSNSAFNPVLAGGGGAFYEQAGSLGVVFLVEFIAMTRQTVGW
jgi:hypothetical protein